VASAKGEGQRQGREIKNRLRSQKAQEKRTRMITTVPEEWNEDAEGDNRPRRESWLTGRGSLGSSKDGKSPYSTPKPKLNRKAINRSAKDLIGRRTSRFLPEPEEKRKSERQNLVVGIILAFSWDR